MTTSVAIIMRNFIGEFRVRQIINCASERHPSKHDMMYYISRYIRWSYFVDAELSTNGYCVAFADWLLCKSTKHSVESHDACHILMRPAGFMIPRSICLCQPCNFIDWTGDIWIWNSLILAYAQIISNMPNIVFISFGRSDAIWHLKT